MEVKKEEIYVGIGTAIITVGSFFLIRKILRKTKKVKIDLSVFDSPDLKGSGQCIDSKLLAMLIDLEAQSGYPIFQWISSGIRTPYWNKKVGGVNNSSHKTPKCKAVDIKIPSITIRNHLVTLAHKIGFKRMGIANTFIHLDVDEDKSQYVAWGYPKGTLPPINPFI